MSETTSDPHAGLTAGTFHITAQERVVFGMPAGEAIVAEAERVGAKRVFVTSTRSLAQKEMGPLQRVARGRGGAARRGLVTSARSVAQKEMGPLQRIERALGARHVGTYATIRSHSPREDV